MNETGNLGVRIRPAELARAGAPSVPFTIMLITEDDSLERRLSAALGKGTSSGRLVRANPIEAALARLRGDSEIDAVILDRHTSGWVSAETCSVIAGATRAGVTIGLVREHVVLPMREALTSRLDGTYYRNQVDRHLLRRLRSLAARRRVPSGNRRLAEPPEPSN
jgi:hypothetical protein